MLELLPDPHHDIPKIESALKLYLAVLRGFLEPPNNPTNKTAEEEVASGGTRASKLRLAVRFRWSQSMLGTSSPEAQNDAAFEVCSSKNSFYDTKFIIFHYNTYRIKILI